MSPSNSTGRKSLFEQFLHSQTSGSLVLGKQIGILLFSWLTVRSGAAELPAGVSWLQLWGASALAGIGFTMSIFVSELAFTDEALIAEAKIAIFIASFVAAVCGWLVLNKVLPKKS